MPTRMKRYNVSLPADLRQAIMKQAKLNVAKKDRKIAAQIQKDLLDKYQFVISQPMIFGRPHQPIAKESQQSRLLSFGGPSRREAEPSLNRRASHGKA